ncbi:hypothetical protein ACWGLF_15635 [Streptomyces puniciscabiei]
MTAGRAEHDDLTLAFRVEILFMVREGADADAVVRSAWRVGAYVVDGEDGAGAGSALRAPGSGRQCTQAGRARGGPHRLRRRIDAGSRQRPSVAMALALGAAAVRVQQRRLEDGSPVVELLDEKATCRSRLEYSRSVPSRRPRRRMTLSVVTMDADGPATKLPVRAVNGILAALSSFYEYAIPAGLLERANPIAKRPDPALQRVSDRHRPFSTAFMGRASRQRPVRRATHVKTVQRVPRPWTTDPTKTR